MTLIFCPGFKLLTPILADEPEGFGTILSGALLCLGFAFGVVFLVAFGDAFGFGLPGAVTEEVGEVITLPSLTVTLIF